jgi:hypothetical protein
MSKPILICMIMSITFIFISLLPVTLGGGFGFWKRLTWRERGETIWTMLLATILLTGLAVAIGDTIVHCVSE